jgi:hypothetical protein
MLEDVIRSWPIRNNTRKILLRKGKLMQRNTGNETQNFSDRSAENENLRPLWCQSSWVQSMQYRYDVVLCGCNDEYDRGEYSETTCPDLGDCSEVPHDEFDYDVAVAHARHLMNVVMKKSEQRLLELDRDMICGHNED